MPKPRFQRANQKNRVNNKAIITNELEFSEELTEPTIHFDEMKPVPQPKDYDEIEY
ncbi:hypothetical protein [Calidifontibacillus oryziterrae]|uniref:hypothetical protein n=1 Tax=Calidifontibacillus oryziterrae TaxID=1191699 RepID=UPI0002E036D6|nr:hypothetical protein [Calidifontibacillus oryziterrae]